MTDIVIIIGMMICALRLYELAPKKFNSSSIHSYQRIVAQHLQEQKICQAIAVIRSRIMEESPNSFPMYR
jgi:hypothetical protein